MKAPIQSSTIGINGLTFKALRDSSVAIATCIALERFLSTIVASRAKVRQIRSSQLAIARPISSGVSSCTKWRPLTTTRC
jgi:hypothetical protein